MQSKLNQMIEICTKRSVKEIIDEIRIKKENKETVVLTPDSIRYKNFVIDNNKITVHRNPHLFLPFRGIGEIIFDLSEVNNQTIIKCKVDPFKTEYLIWMAILGFLFLAMGLPFVLIGQYIVLTFILLGYSLILIVNFFWIRFNRKQLLDTLNNILIDLNLK